MLKTKLSDQEKKDIIKSILGANHSAVGKHFPIFSEMMNGLGTFNDALTFAELLPTLSTWLSGAAVASITSAAAFSGTILFPFQQAINVINANETGLRAYSYRAISYTITAWAFDKLKPISSPRILSNLTSGPYTTTKDVSEYHKVWRETLISVITQLELTCLQKNIKKQYLKSVFKALGQGSPEKLSVLILKGFEKEFSHVAKHIWVSNYSVAFPR